MSLMLLLLLLLIGALLALVADRTRLCHPAWVALATLLAGMLVLLDVFSSVENATHVLSLGTELVESRSNYWFVLVDYTWIPRFGISFLLGMDGLSWALVLMTLFLGVVAVLSSWREVTERVGFFYFNLLLTLAGVVGVFTALDLFLFFVFWEVMLVPMYLLIGIWGHENKTYAALKFFIFTQASGLLLLLATVLLALAYQDSTGQLSFNYFALLHLPDTGPYTYWLMLGFFIAFVVKLPGVPVHSWLPDAHTQAPTAGSVILAGILLKTGAYGLLRFALPLFPEASVEFAPIAMSLGVISIVYGAILAFAQTDVKRLIAYTSISHMGFVLVGLYAWNEQAQQGAVMTLFAHGMTSAALFAFAGSIQQRLHTRDMREMGGFWDSAPRMGGLVMFFSIAALGMPGLANFVGEFLVLVGSFQSNPTLTVLACFGLVLAPVYSLWVIQQVFHGQRLEPVQVKDYGGRETLMMGMMLLVTLGLGVYPQPVFELVAPMLRELQELQHVGHLQAAVGVMLGGGS